MTATIRRASVLAMLWSLAAVVLWAADVRVTPLVTDGQVYASFNAGESYTADVHEAVQSGLPTTLTFFVELRQASVIWFDRNVATVTVAASIKYDTLRGDFQVSKMADGQVFSSERTDKEADARKWATEFERVRLSNGANLESNGEYYVRVRLRTTPRRSVSLWPWGRDDAAGRADFTFIR
jgi:hypothetical protein